MQELAAEWSDGSHWSEIVSIKFYNTCEAGKC